MLPVLTTKAEVVAIRLHEDAIIDPSAAASPKLASFPNEVHISFCPATAARLALSTASPSGQPDPPQLVAGEDLAVTVRALDAFDNLCEAQECTFFLEAEAVPTLDDALSGASLRAREPPQRFLVQLSRGQVTQRVPVRVAGELWVRLLQPSAHGLDSDATQRLRVVPAPAISIDVLNLPEQSRAGVDFEIVVRALDQFGNVDESFERDVTLAADGPQGSDFNLPNDGVVRLSRGLAKLRVQRADYVARLNANADSPTRVPRSPRAPNQGLDLS